MRAKDIKNYSSEDKSAIFGGLPKQEATAKESNPTKKEDITLLEVGSESEVQSPTDTPMCTGCQSLTNCWFLRKTAENKCQRKRKAKKLI